MPDFSYRLYRQDSDVLLAISDSDIVGETFSEGDLEISVHKEFYHEHACDSSKALDLVKSSTIINAVGKKIISMLIEGKFVEDSNILIISGVPHAQIVVVQG